MKKKIVFYRLFSAGVSVMLTVFSGCTVPMTKEIINDVGVNNTTQFQCYISESIVLSLATRDNKTEIVDGRLIKSSKTAREKIVIPANLPGLVRKGYERGNGDGFQLDVAFENYEGNPVLSFGQYYAGAKEKYFLLYDDNKNRLVKYGNDSYKVTYNSGKVPYLEIKKKQSSQESAKSRRAKGLKLPSSATPNTF